MMTLKCQNLSLPEFILFALSLVIRKPVGDTNGI